MRINILATVFILLASVGCGTLSGSKQVVSVTSEPTDADIVKEGKVVGTTPGNVVLDTNNPDDHSFKVRKEGYEPKELKLSTSTDASIIFGNFLLGGAPILVDLATDNLDRFEKTDFFANLSKKAIAERNNENQKRTTNSVFDKEVEGDERSSTGGGGESVFTENDAENPEQSATSFPTSRVDKNIPMTEMRRPDDIAVVIGNRAYKNSDIPDVDYAVRDAQTMKKYLTRTLGFREENILYVENASGSAMTRIFGTSADPKGQLHDYVRPGESSVFVYYSGHGAPNPESGDAYLLPSNANPSYLSQNGYPLGQLYENLAKVPAQSATVVLEACFSGTSEGGAVVQNASPAVLSVENPVMGMENGLALTAGATDQIASWYPEKGHGLFTYYFLKGLRGNADVDGNSAVTAEEMKSYLTDKVPYRAQRMHSRKQTPGVIGQDLGRVLVRYDGGVPATQPEARLPVSTTEVQPSVMEALSLPENARKVTEAGGVDALQEGDVIIAVGESKLESGRSLSEVVSERAPGDTLQFEILREGENRTVSVTLPSSR